MNWSSLLKKSTFVFTFTIVSWQAFPQIARASRQCDWFTGVYADQGIGVIVHIGGGNLIVYNGNPRPVSGRCIDGNTVNVRFTSEITLIGERTGSDIKWGNDTTWTRRSRNVTFPLNFF